MAEDSGKVASDKLVSEFRVAGIGAEHSRAYAGADSRRARGPAYRTVTQLQLREDHAAARDAVRAELDVTCGVRCGICGAMETLRSVDARDIERRIFAASLAGPRIQRRLAHGNCAALRRGARCAGRDRRRTICFGDWCAGSAIASSYWWRARWRGAGASARHLSSIIAAWEL